MRFARLFVLLSSLIASSALLAACDDDPLFGEVSLTTDTVTISVPGTSVASAVDLARVQSPYTLLRRPELVQDASEWDVALRRSGAGLVLLPYREIGSPYRGAGIAPTSTDFDRIDEAPRATTAYDDEAVAVAVNNVYYLRSRQYPTSSGLCVNYAKAKIMAVDAAAGTAQVALTINQNCDDERLVDD